MKLNLVLGAALVLVLFAAQLLPAVHSSQSNNLAPGAPGQDAQWTNAGKEAVGTSTTLESKVWFTLRDGVMTEVYYPTVDVANTQVLQFIIVSGDGKRIETEQDDTTHRIEALNAEDLSFRQTNTSKTGAYTITKTYVTDSERSTVLISVQFKEKRPGEHQLYVYYDPSLNNSGMHDTAWTQGRALLASDADKASALLCQYNMGRSTSLPALEESTNGYLETSDGLLELRANRGKLVNRYPRAADGNVIQVGHIGQNTATTEVVPESFTVALAFGREPDEALTNARASLTKGFAKARAEYESGWKQYLNTVRRVESKYQKQFNMAAMVLKAHEDKTYRGAMIASLSVPWGGGSNANEPNVGGYHLVWARDLYQVATAFHALGDKASADRALDYLFRVQQKPDGSFPQNSWLDGRPFWGSLQMDEVAYPLVLAYQLGRTDNETWTKHVRPAADFIVKHGPYSPQERWEEESGFSPSTIAAEIAGLVCAAEIATRNGDETSASIYIAAADDWTRNIDALTGTTSGKHSDGPYYLRVTENDDPNDGEPRELNNGAGTFDEREIVDAGFLELVRLGIKAPNDPLIIRTLSVIDRVIKVDTPHGPGFYRYNHDGYGEMDDGRPWNWDGKYTGKGRLWALLSGERGQYELAAGEKVSAQKRLDSMQGFANEGLMIPEQVWDMGNTQRADLHLGEGTGSATPLAWSMAQFIRLATSLQEGRNLDTPEIVAARYVKKSPPLTSNDAVNFPADEVRQTMEAGSSFRVSGRAEMRVFAMHGDQRFEIPIKYEDKGRFSFEVTVPRGRSTVMVGTIGKSGATSFHRVQINGLTVDEKRSALDAGMTPQLVERIKAAKTSPVIDRDTATFIYRGAAKRVEVVGDHTGWEPAGHVFRELAGTNTWYYKMRFPPDARVEYKLIADGEWILDALNPDKFDNGVGGENSNFTMPKYVSEIETLSSGVLRGTLETLELPNDSKRRIRVYLPPGYAKSAERYPVLYLQDGSQYIQLGLAAAIADRLIAEKKLEPFILVFIDPIDRWKEYAAGDAFADFMARGIVPFVDAKYRTRPDRDNRALLGASLGGVISVWTALRHPDVFARVGGQSSAFQINNELVVDRLSKLELASKRTLPLRFYFDAGRMESLLGVNRRVNVMLAAKGYPITYHELNAGHNYTTWRDQLGNAFVALWKR